MTDSNLPVTEDLKDKGSSGSVQLGKLCRLQRRPNHVCWTPTVTSLPHPRLTAGSLQQMQPEWKQVQKISKPDSG